jgi:hypothetical protein
VAPVVQQQQEEQRDLVRRLAVLLACVSAGAGCGDEPNAEVAVVAAGEALAWSGGTQELGLVLEPLAPVQQSSSSAISEREMLRERFELQPELDLMRLHMIGPAEALAEVGQIQMNGVTYSAFPAADSNLPAAQRLLWDGVLRGLPVVESSESGAPIRRSVIVSGSAASGTVSQAGKAVWTRAEESAVLSRKVWSAAARRAHFDAATAVPEPPAHPAAGPSSEGSSQGGIEPPPVHR